MRLADWLSLRLKAWTASGPTGPFGGHATLTDDLVAYWTLDEASGVRADSVGTNDLTDNNTVGSAAGKFNDAASFVAVNIETLSRVDNADLSLGARSKTVAVWFNHEGTASSRVLFSKDASGQREYVAFLNATQVVEFYVFNTVGGGANANTAATTSGAWHLAVVWFDIADNRLRCQIDNGTIFATAALAGTANDGTAAFVLGANFGTSSPYQGLLDEAAMWNRVLTVQERADLWNSGSGLFYGS